MSILKQNFGIDVSLADFEVAFGVLMEDHEFKILSTKTFNNTEKGINAFLQWLNKINTKKGNPSLDVHVTLEPTGIYHEHLVYALYGHNHTLHLVLPNQAKKYGQSLGYRSKTDPLDAKSLAQMGAERKLRIWKPISNELQRLKSLTRERAQRVQERTQAYNQRHALENSKRPLQKSIKRIQQLIDFLDRQIKDIEGDIFNLVKKDQVLASKMDKITSIKGVAMITAATVVAETDGFAAFTSIKQLQSYAGYDVQIKQSGKWQGRSTISKQGNSHIRAILHMAALAAIKNTPEFYDFKQRLTAKGKANMVAITAVERKLLVLIYTLWKKDEYYDPAFYNRQSEKLQRQNTTSNKRNQQIQKDNTPQDKYRVMPEPVSSFGLPLNKKQWTLRPTALDKHRFNASPYVFLR